MNYNFGTINARQKKIINDGTEYSGNLLDEEIAEKENGQTLEVEDEEEI